MAVERSVGIMLDCSGVAGVTSCYVHCVVFSGVNDRSAAAGSLLKLSVLRRPNITEDEVVFVSTQLKCASCMAGITV